MTFAQGNKWGVGQCALFELMHFKYIQSCAGCLADETGPVACHCSCILMPCVCALFMCVQEDQVEADMVGSQR